MTYRDMTFCHTADRCKNREGCWRWLSPELQEKARQWWGGDDYPVTFGDFSTACPKWEGIEHGHY